MDDDTQDGSADALWRPIVEDGIVPQVVERLAVAIHVGALEDGERLPSSRELASRFEISRGLVHEALGELAEQGLVSIRRGRAGGTFVQGVAAVEPASDAGDAGHVLQAALLIEGSIAAAVASRRQEAALHPIASLHRRIASTSFDADLEELAREASDALVLATDNPQLVRIHRQIRDDLDEVAPPDLSAQGARERLVSAQQRLMTALVRGRPEPARRSAHAALVALHTRAG